MGTDVREPLKELSACGLPAALEVMGERWSFMILRASFNGVQHFEEFLSELGIARNILSNRLSRLVEHGILDRVQDEQDRRRVEYALTEKGFDLLPAMVSLRHWGLKYGVEGIGMDPVIVDERDRMPIGPVAMLAHDGRILGSQGSARSRARPARRCACRQRGRAGPAARSGGVAPAAPEVAARKAGVCGHVPSAAPASILIASGAAANYTDTTLPGPSGECVVRARDVGTRCFLQLSPVRFPCPSGVHSPVHLR